MEQSPSCGNRRVSGQRPEWYGFLERLWNEGVHSIWLTHGNRYYAGRADLMVDYNISNDYLIHTFRLVE